MSNIVKTALQLVDKGYNVIPIISSRKIPALKEKERGWSLFQKRNITKEEVKELFKEEHAIGMLTGGSPRVFCIDVDCKYDLTGDLWERFKSKIPTDILKECLIQETRNAGYHLVVKVPASRLTGNERLALRYTTAEEKHQTYMEYFQDFTRRDLALKTAINDKHRVLIETRSGTADICGGYFLIFPSKGYRVIGGKVGEINEEQYDTLVEIARSLSEVTEIHQPKERVNDFATKWEKTPFEDYVENGDPLEVLEDSGWEVTELTQKTARLKRPGKTHSSSSAIFDLERKILNVFSTSTCFEVGRGYDPVGVFCLLECEGDLNECYRKLISLGYGKKES